ncbi:MAG TPA: hypothetical protein PLY80_09835 [Pseudomonadota bacterium]|nr:hypothetical protein [Pseudomonadota bacterium]
MMSMLRRKTLAPWLWGILLLTSCTTARDGANDIVGAGPGRTPDDPPEQGRTLTLLPADPIVTNDGKTPYEVLFRVQLGNQDITDQVRLSIDDERLGHFEGATFKGNPGQGGKSIVRAQRGEDRGQTTLTVRLQVVVIAPGAPMDAPTKFGGSPSMKRTPEIAYPPAAALLPPNINELEFQWRPNDATLFELNLLSDSLDLRIYTPCTKAGDGCALLPDDKTQKMIMQGGRGQKMTLSMRGTGLDGGGVGETAKQDLSFTENDMKGGLYYWAASSGGIARYDFGLRGQKAESYYGPLRAAGVCVGCHAMSRNGKRIAVGMNIPGPALMRALDAGTRNKLFEVGPGVIAGSNFQAFTSDGKWLLTTEYGGLAVRDGSSGMLQGKNPSLASATMPDVAPDGKTVVFARSPTLCIPPLCPNLSTDKASLLKVAFNAVDGTFGTPSDLVKSSGENNYYPSISPDGKYVVFNRAGGDSYDAMDAKVMVVPLAGGSPIDLASVNAIAGNSWPKWSPFVHRYKGKSVMWLSFSSRRPYGVRGGTTAQIWMVPVEINALDKGMDAGYPPIRLPFQELATGNHIAQWVEVVDRAPCSPIDMSGCGPGERCTDGYCVPVIQ